ncbi:MAG: ABC transporter ATP-binding protein [Peptoniphilus sp.]|nr:ABC transporter ATP-binding protein [Peptoniphilus sp.]MDD7362811.1 ABC transporter ATP-binding protein [Bacillota bacterium]MDY6043997.1 ABC transporter ATP-binding protein [Peptoniphilus sp.]
MESIITMRGIQKSFAETQVLKGIDLEVRDHEFLTLLGPSGCGKTTLLRIIAGFEQPDEGDVLLKGQSMTAMKHYERPVNTVFQKYALFPHLNVFDNIAFGLKLKKLPKAEIESRVEEMLELVNLPGIGSRSIASLSGGQQQRIAIARALINDPEILLLDEPLGALDLKLRKRMQFELKRIQEQVGITFIYVTHDQEEALSMSDTVVVLKDGTIQQIGTPISIYNEPVNAFVANFIGESNIIPATFVRDGVVSFYGREFRCVDKGFAPGESVQVVIRPEDVELKRDAEDLLRGEVESLVFKGVHYEMILNVAGDKWMVQSTLAKQPGEVVGLYIEPDNFHVMKGEG